jgi:hypothetical protein
MLIPASLFAIFASSDYEHGRAVVNRLFEGHTKPASGSGLAAARYGDALGIDSELVHGDDYLPGSFCTRTTQL